MKVFSTIFLISFSCSLAVSQKANDPKDQSGSATPQQLRILSQPDAPVWIASAQVAWATPDDRHAVQIYIVVKNVSKKTVHTYVTRRDIASATSPKSCLGPPRLPAAGLLPGEKAGTSTWQGVENSEPAPSVWVDFVEFSDRTRWGADECQTAEWLDGGLAGAHAQRDQLLQMLREKGVEALMSFIRDNFHKETGETTWDRGVELPKETSKRPLLPLTPPAGHSKRWEEGFRAGSERIIESVIAAEYDWGADEIEHVLLRPLHPSEKKSP